VTEPINLNRARKAKARAAATTRAEVNRVKFGRTKAEKAADAAEAARLARAIDQAKREE
jgi:hypothetical protein